MFGFRFSEVLAEFAYTGQLLIRCMGDGYVFSSCSFSLVVSLYCCGPHGGDRGTFIAVAVVCRCTTIDWGIDDTVLFVEVIACELRSESQHSQSSANRS